MFSRGGRRKSNFNMFSNISQTVVNNLTENNVPSGVIPFVVKELEPEPVVVAEPEPEPVVVAEPEPEPVVVAEPEPEPVIVAEPEPEPVVVAEPEPEPVVVAEPEPEPVVVAEPEPEPVVVAPSEPNLLDAIPSNSTITVLFDEPLENGGSPILSYQYSLDAGWSSNDLEPPCVSSPMVITGLTNGATCTLKIRAVNAAGPGAFSRPIIVTPEE